MCLNPIKLTNPSCDFHLGKDRQTITVPCGKCHECRNAKRNEWKIRCYYEYEETRKLGGVTLFVTYTYNDEHLPIQTDHSGCTYRVFSKKDIKNYFKNVRHGLEKLGYTLPNKDRSNLFNLDFKYIICSEYGGTFGRPHYHALLFFKGTIFNLNSIKHVIEDKWATYDRTTKTFVKNGFIKFGKNEGIVYGEGAIKYVTKYLCKDLDYVEKYKDSILADKLGYINFDDALPFHFQSQGLGIYALKANTPEQLRSGLVYCPNSTNRNKEYMPIPQYLDRKYLYNVRMVEKLDHSFPRYELTDFGKEVMIYRAYEDISNLKEKFDGMLVNHDNFDLSFINKHSNTNLFFNSYPDLINYAKSLISPFTTFEVALFSRYINSRFIPGHEHFSVYLDSAEDIFSNLICDYSESNFRLDPKFAEDIDFQIKCYQPYYEKFNDFLDLFQLYNRVISFERNKQFEFNRKVINANRPYY